jgi:predicted nucleotidyltransferase
MLDTVFETPKRLDISYKESEKLKKVGALGVLLAGSVAYSPNVNVTNESDVDILAVFHNIKNAIDTFVEDPKEAIALKNRTFDGYSFKYNQEDVPVSVHLLSADSFDVITKCFVADIRLYRPKAKFEEYKLLGFEGDFYNYKIKNVVLNDLTGVRTIVPVSFINEDNYFLGIHRDKLLSNPVVLLDTYGIISLGIDKLWDTVINVMKDESNRKYNMLNLEKMSVLNALSRKSKMSVDVISKIIEKQSRVLNNYSF